MDFFAVSPNGGRVIGPIGEYAVLQLDIKAIVLDIFFHLLSKAHRLAATHIDHACDLVLCRRSDNQLCKILHADKIILVFPCCKRKFLFAVGRRDRKSVV